MKIDSYYVGQPLPGTCKQHGVWATEGNTVSPIMYLQRPKWITDDGAWEELVKSVRLELPHGFEIV